MIGDPPLSAGAANETVAVSSPRIAVTVVGAPGIDAGTIEFESVDVVVPAALVALAWNLYVFPFVRPVITQLVAGGITEQVLAGERATPELLKAVTRIEVVGPTVVPDAATGVGVTVTSVLPAVVETVGTPGATRVH